MSKGFGKIQRAIAALINAQPDGAWAYEHLAERIYGTTLFTRAQKNAIGRALANACASPEQVMGRVASQPSSKDRRFWLFDPCRLEAWRKIAGPRCDPAHFQPRGVYFNWTE